MLVARVAVAGSGSVAVGKGGKENGYWRMWSVQALGVGHAITEW